MIIVEIRNSSRKLSVADSCLVGGLYIYFLVGANGKDGGNQEIRESLAFGRVGDVIGWRGANYRQDLNIGWFK